MMDEADWGWGWGGGDGRRGWFVLKDIGLEYLFLRGRGLKMGRELSGWFILKGLDSEIYYQKETGKGGTDQVMILPSDLCFLQSN